MFLLPWITLLLLIRIFIYKVKDTYQIKNFHNELCNSLFQILEKLVITSFCFFNFIRNVIISILEIGRDHIIIIYLFIIFILENNTVIFYKNTSDVVLITSIKN